MTDLKITPTMRLTLRRMALENRPAAHLVGVRSRAGGSFFRMVDRMANIGLVEKKPPHALTRKGRLAGTGSAKP